MRTLTMSMMVIFALIMLISCDISWESIIESIVHQKKKSHYQHKDDYFKLQTQVILFSMSMIIMSLSMIIMSMILISMMRLSVFTMVFAICMRNVQVLAGVCFMRIVIFLSMRVIAVFYTRLIFRLFCLLKVRKKTEFQFLFYQLFLLFFLFCEGKGWHKRIFLFRIRLWMFDICFAFSFFKVLLDLHTTFSYSGCCLSYRKHRRSLYVSAWCNLL